MHDGNRDAGAVVPVSPIAAFHIVLATVAAQDGLLLEQGALAGDQIDVVDPHRSDERSRADAQPGRIPVGIGTQPGRHQLGVEGDLLRFAVLPSGPNGHNWIRGNASRR
ncbi:hypothetical protein NIIDMKKI_05200 [Mycobacterium kansasii]|uniref:Uncharacterized protein n=1 Tax=Mycobacterium kansasii TaxID=1768 RepID=A0A7G1I496_MYCKA|nr:hypothetical protein NIIDMKKI_05200 [Mycobacterium kansasii]